MTPKGAGDFPALTVPLSVLNPASEACILVAAGVALAYRHRNTETLSPDAAVPHILNSADL